MLGTGDEVQVAPFDDAVIRVGCAGFSRQQCSGGTTEGPQIQVHLLQPSFVRDGLAVFLTAVAIGFVT